MYYLSWLKRIAASTICVPRTRRRVRNFTISELAGHLLVRVGESSPRNNGISLLLAGPIPSELGNFGALAQLDLSVNQLSGEWVHR